jgi:hypothetical protein
LDLRKRNIGNREKVTLKDFHSLYTRLILGLMSTKRMRWVEHATDDGSEKHMRDSIVETARKNGT